MSMSDLNDAALLKTMMSLDPMSLKAFAHTSTRIFNIYQTNKNDIWRTLIYRDLAEGLALFGAQKVMETEPKDGLLYRKCLHAFSNEIWFAVRNPQQPTLPAEKIAHAIHLLLQIHPDLLLQAKLTRYLQMAKFAVRFAPQLLEPIVRLTPKQWYMESDGTDFTWIILLEFQICSAWEQRKALPYLLDLFVEPNTMNKSGYLNQHYSDGTRSQLQSLLLALSSDQ